MQCGASLRAKSSHRGKSSSAVRRCRRTDAPQVHRLHVTRKAIHTKRPSANSGADRNTTHNDTEEIAAVHSGTLCRQATTQSSIAQGKRMRVGSLRIAPGPQPDKRNVGAGAEEPTTVFEKGSLKREQRRTQASLTDARKLQPRQDVARVPSAMPAFPVHLNTSRSAQRKRTKPGQRR